MGVSRGVKSGRLAKCVVRDEAGRPLGLSSIEEADREWAANSDYTDAPQRDPGRNAGPVAQYQWATALEQSFPTIDQPPTGEPAFDQTVAGGAARQKHWNAKLAELKFKAAAGELVSAAEVRGEWSDILSQVRNKLLGVPTRVKQALPALTPADVVLIEDLLREALEDLVSAETKA